METTKKEAAGVNGSNQESYTSNQDKVTKTAVINPSFEKDNLLKNGLSLDTIGKHLNSIAFDREFPVDALPKIVQRIIHETNECLSFPKDFIAASLLHAASTAIGNTHLSNWKWNESGCLFLVLVGNPGTIKTHPINFAYSPIADKDKDYYRNYKEDIKDYDAANLVFMKNKKDGGDSPPTKPILKKHIVVDCTIEALVHVLQNNQRGICSHNDELAGWVNNMNRYSNGSEVQQWLSIWSGQAIVVDRRSAPSIRIERPFVNVIGTIQPAVIQDFAKDNKSKNGFMDRILFVKPEGLKRQGWNKKELDNTVKAEWFRIIQRLLKLDFTVDQDGGAMSVLLSYTPEADSVLREWQEGNIKEDEDYSNESRDGISAKIETYIFRFSLILQLLKWACEEGDKTKIDADTVRSAIRIAKYFKQTALEVVDHIENINPIDRLPEPKKSIYKSLNDEFTTEQGLSVISTSAVGYGISERAFKHWLNDKTLFKKIKHGSYQKVNA